MTQPQHSTARMVRRPTNAEQRVETTLIHVRSRKNRLYLNKDSQWSEQPGSARAFATAREAAEFCRTKELKDAELLILRPNQPPMTLPLSVA